MPKYLISGSYVGEGIKGLLKDGGTKRKQAVEQLIGGLGGTVESLHFAFGDDDFFINNMRIRISEMDPTDKPDFQRRNSGFLFTGTDRGSL